MKLRNAFRLFQKSNHTMSLSYLRLGRLRNKVQISRFSEVLGARKPEGEVGVESPISETPVATSSNYSILLQNEFIKEGYDARHVGWWLLFSSLGILGMILVGGYTRLSKSGLSMVKWKPIDPHLPR